MSRFPELQVVPEVPAWMSEEEVARLRVAEVDIDDATRGFLADLLAGRAQSWAPWAAGRPRVPTRRYRSSGVPEAGAELEDPRPGSRPVSSPENGCHGYYTTQYKELVGDRGGQGSAIGGTGNSDGDPTNDQAHSADGRGTTLQAFLAASCGVGSQSD